MNEFAQNQIRTLNDCVQNHPPGEHPLFFIGSSPSLAATIQSPDYPAAGVIVSANALRDRKSNFPVGDWIIDSGAFTEVAKHGGYRHGVEEYWFQIKRWSMCGNLLIAVAQDWMCEPFALSRTGLSVSDHQRLTIERYDQLIRFDPPVPIMPVLQGYRVPEYLQHLAGYGDRLQLGQWVGVGSVCKRNNKPEEIADIFKTIKLVRPDLRLHGFGLKILALESAQVRSLLYSCDSMAWSYPRRFQPNPPPELGIAHEYQRKVHAAVTDSAQKRVPRTAGAGNGQGRKLKWSHPTKAERLPIKFRNGKTLEDLLAIARQWDDVTS